VQYRKVTHVLALNRAINALNSVEKASGIMAPTKLTPLRDYLHAKECYLTGYQSILITLESINKTAPLLHSATLRV